MMRPALLLALLALAAVAAAEPVRGVRPETAAKYEGDTFTCLDGTKTIPFVAVNDGYCDCSDGSDEPGTPACANGVFYCRNKGHEARVISTAFVDDGVCDCCDGTDELDGCSNTCIEKNAAVREGLKEQVEQYKQALAKKAEYASGAAQRRKDMKARLAGIDGEIADAEKEKERLEGERQKLEETAEARKAVRKEKYDAEMAAREKRRLAREAKAAADAEAAAAAEAEGAAAAAAGEEGAKEGETGENQEETAEERGRRIAAQWTSDPEAAGKAEQEAAEAADKEKKGGSWLSSTWGKIKSAVKGEGSEDKEEPEVGEADWDPAAAEDEGMPPSNPEYDDELEKAKSEVLQAESRIQTLKDDKEKLGRQVTYDYGADDSWLALTSHCSHATGGQFSYRLCLFDKAAQVDTHGGHETNLGKWKGFENGYTEGVFDNGDWCHGHPARSMRVKFQCGLEESAWDGSEPSTCAYAVHMQTPAACRSEDLKYLEERLAALIKEEAELAKEIAEEEEAKKKARAAAAAAAGAKDEL